MNTSLSAAWLIIFETCLKDDSGIDLHDTDIDFFIYFFCILVLFISIKVQIRSSKKEIVNDLKSKKQKYSQPNNKLCNVI